MIMMCPTVTILWSFVKHLHFLLINRVLFDIFYTINFRDLDYTLIRKGRKPFVHPKNATKNVSLSVSLKTFETLEEYKLALSSLQGCRNCYFSLVFGPFLNPFGSMFTSMKIGITFENFLSNQKNARSLVDYDLRKAYVLYKKIIR